MRNLSLVNEYCTCGAKLPEDARFCHKCGKPQREEPEIEALAVESAPEPPPLPVAPPPPPPVGFRNPAAVRAALVSAAIATLGAVVPLPGLFHALWQLLLFVIGGFAAVYLYQRRTHDFLSVRGGLQIGWMTGLFCFLVLMVMLTFVLAIFSALGDAGLKQLASDSGHPQVAEDVSSMLSDPALLVLRLVGSFFMMTMLGSAGGALGSKILDRD